MCLKLNGQDVLCQVLSHVNVRLTAAALDLSGNLTDAIFPHRNHGASVGFARRIRVPRRHFRVLFSKSNVDEYLDCKIFMRMDHYDLTLTLEMLILAKFLPLQTNPL